MGYPVLATTWDNALVLLIRMIFYLSPGRDKILITAQLMVGSIETSRLLHKC